MTRATCDEDAARQLREKVTQKSNTIENIRRLLLPRTYARRTCRYVLIYFIERANRGDGGGDGRGAYDSTISTFLCARFPPIFPLYTDPFSLFHSFSSPRRRFHPFRLFGNLAAGRDLSVHPLVSMAAYLLFSSPSVQRECRAFLSIVVDFGPRVHTRAHDNDDGSAVAFLYFARRVPTTVEDSSPISRMRFLVILGDATASRDVSPAGLNGTERQRGGFANINTAESKHNLPPIFSLRHTFFSDKVAFHARLKDINIK